MASFNKIIIVGYLGRDPELRWTPGGEAVCNVSVATSEKRKNADGDLVDHTTWFRVTLWGRKAEVANEYLSKGSQVYFEGRLRTQEYEDREGNQRTSLEVTASEMQFLSKAESNGGGDYERPAATRQQAKAALDKPARKASAASPKAEDEGFIPDDDIPF